MPYLGCAQPYLLANSRESPTSSVTKAGTKSTKLVTDKLPPIRF